MADLATGYSAGLRWSWEILDCAMPMVLDTLDDCSHQCVYCFSFFQRSVGPGGEDYLHHRVKPVNVKYVKDVFTGKVKSQFSTYINKRFVVQVGGLSDPLDFHERKHGIFLQLLQFFAEIDYPISISTKGVWFAEDQRYVDLLSRGNVHLKSSIISLDENKVRAIERGVATTAQRFDMLRKMSDKGVACTVRFRPLILGMSADFPYTRSSENQIRELVRRSKDSGAISITTEFLCLEAKAKNTAMERYNIIGEHTGFTQPGSLYEFYRQQSDTKSGLMRLNYALKKPYMDAFFEACEKYDIKGFVSDAHHKGRSTAAGCCGLPSEGPLSNYNKGQYAEAILIAREKGKVHWSDIEERAQWLKSIPFYRAENFNTSSTSKRQQNRYNSMFDYMHNCWNVTELNMSPARYFGGELVADGPLDANGDIVYLHNKPWVEQLAKVPNVDALRMELVDRGYKMQEDGEEWAYVGWPVAVNCVDVLAQDAEPLLKQLMKYRLNPIVYVHENMLAEYSAYLPDLEYETVPEINSKADAFQQIVQDAFFKRVARLHVLLGTTTQGGMPDTLLPANKQSRPYAGGVFGSRSPRAYLSVAESLHNAGISAASTKAIIDPTLMELAANWQQDPAATIYETGTQSAEGDQWH